MERVRLLVPGLLLSAASAAAQPAAQTADDGKLPLPWAIAASVVLSLVVAWLRRRKR